MLMTPEELRIQAGELRKKADALNDEADRLFKWAEQQEEDERNRKLMFQTMVLLEDCIWNHFYPKSPDAPVKDPSQPNEGNVGMWMNADIAHILSDPKFSRDMAEDYIRKLIDWTMFSDEIYKEIRWDNILEQVAIRRDFASALKSVKKGTDLSEKLGWAFSNNDLRQLMELHRKNKFRRKIEDLLEDCNFHYECGMLSERRYDELETELSGEKEG